MDRTQLYQDIALRTGGDIYFGVVGPVRTGKSTFIKRFMDLMVLPGMEDEFAKARLTDELPQSGAGKTIMTTQPKFVPNQAVELFVDENVNARVRMVDCVGYMVEGAAGHVEDDMPRMVRTPWFEHDIPFEEAAEIGTRKVITEHSTIGVVVTTDGSITDIRRENYVAAEERVIRELKEQGKPFVILLNSQSPQSEACQTLAEGLEEKYGMTVLPMDVLHMDAIDIHSILHGVLLEFPIRNIRIAMPTWLSALTSEHWLLQRLFSPLYEALEAMRRMKDHPLLMEALTDIEGFEAPVLRSISPGTGEITLELRPVSGMFYSVLGEECGYQIKDDAHLIQSIKAFVQAKQAYDRLKGALDAAEATGYGMVAPSMSEMVMEEPEIVQHGGRFGVKLKARASGMHMIRVDIAAEVSPLVGTEEQSEAFMSYLRETFATDPAKIWDTDIFGKPLYDLVRENMEGKVNRLPPEAQQRLQQTIERMVNDGCNGLVCVLL